MVVLPLFDPKGRWFASIFAGLGANIVSDCNKKIAHRNVCPSLLLCEVQLTL